MVAAFLDDLKRGERLAETHLRIPKHDVSAAVELPDCLVYCFTLLWTEYDFFFHRYNLVAVDGCPAFLYSLYRFDGCVDTALEPLASLIFLREIVPADA